MCSHHTLSFGQLKMGSVCRPLNSYRKKDLQGKRLNVHAILYATTSWTLMISAQEKVHSGNWYSPSILMYMSCMVGK